MKKQLLYVSAVVALTMAVVLSTMIVCFSLINKSEYQAQPVATTLDTLNKDQSRIVNPTGSIAIPGFSRMTMKAGQTLQNVSLYNPEQNKCYMVISIMLPDKKVLYRSGMLKPGESLKELEIEQNLSPGIYENAALQYTCYSLEDRTELNGAETIFTLEVIQ